MNDNCPKCPIDSGCNSRANRELRAALATPLVKVAGWQPIATAPRDGSWILVCRINYLCNYIMTPQATYWTDHAACWAYIPLHPTHWMPLPAPPSEEEK